MPLKRSFDVPDPEPDRQVHIELVLYGSETHVSGAATAPPPNCPSYRDTTCAGSCGGATIETPKYGYARTTCSAT